MGAKSTGTNSANQGEGDRESDRRFREDEQAFVNSPRGKEAAKHAGDVSEKERQEIERAEREAGRHARERDPEEKVDFGKKS